jgi:hypothetical protein
VLDEPLVDQRVGLGAGDEQRLPGVPDVGGGRRLLQVG